MGVPDGSGFRLLSKCLEKYRKSSAIIIISGNVLETIHAMDGTEINPGTYTMYIDRVYTNGLESYELVILSEDRKIHCSIYEILKTTLIQGL